MASSTVEIKILPSPMRPVRAAFMMASTARSTTASSQITSIFTFGQEVHDIFRAAIQLGMPFLAAKALGFNDGNPLEPDLVQSLLHFVELERLNDRFDLFHVVYTRHEAGVLLQEFMRTARSRASQWADAIP